MLSSHISTTPKPFFLDRPSYQNLIPSSESEGTYEIYLKRHFTRLRFLFHCIVLHLHPFILLYEQREREREREREMMGMMGYSDDGEFNLPDSFNGRKLRPLIPRPLLSANNNSTTTPSCLSRLHGTDFFSQCHHLTVAEQNKREYNTPPVVVSSRWNPTPEQLRALEELYRRGTRTPSAEQIQHITAQLRRHGKIEGKNVFYWFQNHKARERQKRRRQMESASDEHHCDIENLERKELGAGCMRTVFEVEQTKNWAPYTNCSILAEESVSVQKSAKAAALAECRTDGWIQFDEGELQQRRNFVETNATLQMMQLSCCAPPTHLIYTPTLSAAATSNITTTTTKAPATVRTIDQKFIKTRDLNIFMAPYRESSLNLLDSVSNEEDSCGDSQTLQLFPLQSIRDVNDNINDRETEISDSAMNANFTPFQFFEFLPLKN